LKICTPGTWYRSAIFILILFFSFLIEEARSLAQDQAPKKPHESEAMPPLTQEMAMTRWKQIHHVSYALWISLGPDSREFLGRATLRFDLKPKAQEIAQILPIDFEKGSIRSVAINGSQITNLSQPERYDGHHLYLKTSELIQGTNKIDISYAHVYSENGNGLYRFTDPVDKKSYIYSNFEPYHAHLMLPCFDQPDLKAPLELTVEAPSDWEVISNTLEREKSKIESSVSWAFPATPLLSPYLFALHAGPYKSWNADANGIPIRLFARQSMAKYVDDKEWLKITQDGLDFYGVQFGYPYPFAKYDQLIVPDFNVGGMENAGAVTYSEHFIYRTKITNEERRKRALVILHEMAHMWFGDLVTMRWWNGLWLNESFATFASTEALDKISKYREAWPYFFANSKGSAYKADQMVTTHPIEVPVPNTDSAEANFDSITYGKGASVLKQLSFYMGEDDFREGLQRYFQKYNFRNSTLSDFLKILSEASNKNIGKWGQSWIETQGLNTIRVNWTCKENPQKHQKFVEKFELRQAAPSDGNTGSSRNILRTHRTRVAFFNFPKRGRSSPLVLSRPVDVTYAGPVTDVQEAIGLTCPDFVFPNYQDYDYAKIELDPISFEQAKNNLGRISDPMTRLMVWHSLWEMVIDNKILPKEYSEIALRELPHEKGPEILSTTLEHLINPFNGTNSILKLLEASTRPTIHTKLEVLIKSRLFAAPAGSNEQLIWFDATLKIASSPQSKTLLTQLLRKKQKLKGLPIDQERRWEIIQTLSRLGTPDAPALIQAELKADPTDIGQRNAILAQAFLPDTSIKNYWLGRILKRDQTTSPQTASPSSSGELQPVEIQSGQALTFAKLRTAMNGFSILNQETYTRAIVSSYFEELPRISAESDSEYARTFARLMYPSICDPQVVQQTNQILEKRSNLPAAIVRTLKNSQQEESRCIQIRASQSRSLSETGQ
jgi:aminopeptidase N